MTKEGHENLILKEQVINALLTGRNEGIPTTENEGYLALVKQQEELADSDETGDARIKLSIDTAEILFHAGYIEEAKETLEDVGN